MLVPPVKTREVARIPCLAESRSTQIPVWADFTRHGAQKALPLDNQSEPLIHSQVFKDGEYRDGVSG